MQFNALKLVTFDATNTLLKFRIPPIKHYANVAREYGFKGSDADLKKSFSDGFKYMWAKHSNFGRSSIKYEQWWYEVVKATFANQMLSYDSVDKTANRLIEEFKTSKCWELAEGSVEALNHLRNLDICIGVISNTDPRLHNVLENLSLRQYFKFVLTSYDAGFCKPDKRIFDLALNKMPQPIMEKECLHIGDDVHKDYDGARAAGWYSILVSDEVKNNINLPSRHVIRNLGQLVSIIQK